MPAVAFLNSALPRSLQPAFGNEFRTASCVIGRLCYNASTAHGTRSNPQDGTRAARKHLQGHLMLSLAPG